MTINVEYNQLDPLLRATTSPDGDVNDATGFSPFPGAAPLPPPPHPPDMSSRAAVLRSSSQQNMQAIFPAPADRTVSVH